MSRRKLLKESAAAVAGLAASPRRPIAASVFQPTWESLQQYRCPEWFRDAKFGISAHWDAQSVPEQGDRYAQLIYEDDEPDHKYHVQHYGHPSKVGFKEIDHLWRAERWQPEPLIQGPAFSNSSAMPSLPRVAAQASGVVPSSSRAFTSAP